MSESRGGDQPDGLQRPRVPGGPTVWNGRVKIDGVARGELHLIATDPEVHLGLEFGQMFRRFGSGVTIIQSAARLMMIEDDDVSDEVAAILRDDGITVLTSSMSVRVEPAGGRLRLTVHTQDGERQVEGSHLLSAIGRIPNTDALTPEAAGIRLDDRGFMKAVVDADTGQIPARSSAAKAARS